MKRFFGPPARPGRHHDQNSVFGRSTGGEQAESTTTQKNAPPKKKQQNKGRVNLGALYRCSLVRAAASALAESAVGMPSGRRPSISGSFLISVFHPKQDRCMRDKAVARITYWRCEISDGTLMHMQVHRGTCFSRINQNNSLINGTSFQIWAKWRYLSLVSKLPWLMRIPRGTYCRLKKADFRAPKHLLVVGFGDIDYPFSSLYKSMDYTGLDNGRGSTDRW